MEQKRISFETAKLAKEKGLDISCDKIYDYKGNLITVYADGHFVKDNRWYLAPPQSVLQTWLWWQHDIIVLVNDYKKFDNAVHYSYTVNKSDSENWHLSYEDALEKGLQEALKLIE